MSNGNGGREARRDDGRADRRRSLERFQVLNDFVDLGLAGLARSEIAVWLILYRDCRPNGLSRTSLADLGRRGGLSRRQATRVLRSLIGRGAVHVVRKGTVGRATVYSLYSPAVLERIRPQVGPWLRPASPAPAEVDTDVRK